MLVVYAILAYIATIVSLIILRNFLPAWFISKPAPLPEALKPAPLPEALSGFLLYVFFFYLHSECLSRSGLSYSRLLGPFPGWNKLVRYSLWAVPLLIPLHCIYLSSIFAVIFYFSRTCQIVAH